MGIAKIGMIRVRKEVIETWLKNKSSFPRNIEEMACHMNISSALFSYILSGKRQITPNVLRKLCDLTGYDVGDICFYDRNS